MNKFLNKTCPVCRNKILEDDETVVCPECGTPHHRECYFKYNKCALEELHGSFEWKGMLPDEAETSPEEQELKDEKNVGFDPSVFGIINSDGSINLKSAEPEEFDNELDKQIYQEISELISPAATMFSADIDFTFFKIMAKRLSDPSKGKDGISMRELVYYSSTSFFHYQKSFTDCMLGMKKPHFNLAAGLFTPIFQFYRKMNGIGFATVLFILITEGLPMYLHSTGVIGDSLTSTLITFGGILSTLLMVFFALFNDNLYYNHCVKKITKIRRRFQGKIDTIEYYHALRESGKPSMLMGLFGCLLTVFVRVFITVILTK